VKQYNKRKLKFFLALSADPSHKVKSRYQVKHLQCGLYKRPAKDNDNREEHNNLLSTDREIAARRSVGSRVMEIIASVTILMLICFLPVAYFLLSGFDIRARHYSFVIYDGIAIVLSYRGSEEHVVIPRSLRGFPVVVIQNFAFQGNEAIQKVTIPDTVQVIADSAFSSCSNLIAVMIPQSVVSFGRAVFAFSHENFTIYGSSPSHAEEYAGRYDIPFISIAARRLHLETHLFLTVKPSCGARGGIKCPPYIFTINAFHMICSTQITNDEAFMWSLIGESMLYTFRCTYFPMVVGNMAITQSR
jgi:hypothetical protein